ncbi:MAG: 7-carboxy-7-deazaguanine synthase QueE, partial [Candidatus Omnitrophica bacterium]|nr:7-carboxy-7-deazaguanine synthase QueE [Candidatus Omnitrophota bacterium]
FLKELLPGLRKLNLKIYLETNATLPDEFKKISRCVDIVAADIKLPSVTKNKAFWGKHLDFLKAAGNKKLFVKIITSDKVKTADFKMALSLMNKVSSNIPLVIQPVMKNKVLQISVKKLFALQDYALKFLDNVYVIPQLHKIIGIK